ncbi:unnamed protein product [Anisakis simplex]|uniref:Uncharacterized protein n=1 Tax=Anisakis simplex TaxID=6269 RepID=A0A0M3J3F2_ANISI|nr:unnamed protein product [Anisakis simplex]
MDENNSNEAFNTNGDSKLTSSAILDDSQKWLPLEIRSNVNDLRLSGDVEHRGIFSPYLMKSLKISNELPQLAPQTEIDLISRQRRGRSRELFG